MRVGGWGMRDEGQCDGWVGISRWEGMLVSS